MYELHCYMCRGSKVNITCASSSEFCNLNKCSTNINSEFCSCLISVFVYQVVKLFPFYSYF